MEYHTLCLKTLSPLEVIKQMDVTDQLDMRIYGGNKGDEAAGVTVNRDAGERRLMAKQAGAAGWKLHRSHVVEGVVQLLADGLVLQFLGIQLIYWSTGGWRGKEVQRKRAKVVVHMTRRWKGKHPHHWQDEVEERKKRQKNWKHCRERDISWTRNKKQI